MSERVRRGLKASQIKQMRFNTVDLPGEWKEALGTPELNGSWIVYGASGNGKSTFLIEMAKTLSAFAKVAINSLEEGVRCSLQQKIIDLRVSDDHDILFLRPETLSELRIRLKKRRAPRIVIIDSLQYFMKSPEDTRPIDTSDYWDLMQEFPDVLFIFNSHMDGNLPAGSTAKKIQYHSDIKIKVDHFVAFVISRYGEGGSYTVWMEGAQKYWTDLQLSNQ